MRGVQSFLNIVSAHKKRLNWPLQSSPKMTTSWFKRIMLVKCAFVISNCLEPFSSLRLNKQHEEYFLFL